MNRMQEWLVRAASELGLRVEVAYQAPLSHGRVLVSQVYFPDLSNPRGILVFEWSDKVEADARKELALKGIGVSTFGEPGPTETFDLESYKEMFSEWGWTGPMDRKPAWME